jgi:hypothetical protein
MGSHRRFRLVAVALFVVLVPPVGASRALTSESRVFEVFSPEGIIGRVSVSLPTHVAASSAEIAANAGRVVPLQVSGPSANRFDLVIVGDGYTESELPLFHEHAAAKWQTIRDTEPFASYVNYFNVWMVDVISEESGVDNDPLPIVKRKTSLDMEFWCGGTERLLCMNETKAKQYADLAPAADQVLGLANSTKYGGAGGAYATSSGGNVKAGQITVHELGHSIGGLADEYDYYYRLGLDEDAEDDVRIPAPYVVYVGGEVNADNVTKFTHERLADSQRKWWRWLGEMSPDGTPVSTYEGANYSSTAFTGQRMPHSCGSWGSRSTCPAGRR